MIHHGAKEGVRRLISGSISAFPTEAQCEPFPWPAGSALTISGLDFTPTHFDSLPDDTPTVVVCHGLTGGSHESYVRNVLAWVTKEQSEGGLGARAVVVNVSALLCGIVFRKPMAVPRVRW